MIYEVCYHVGDGIYSTNMLSGGPTAAQILAEEHAIKYGYKLCSLREINDVDAAYNKRKGMPLIDVHDVLTGKNKKYI